MNSRFDMTCQDRFVKLARRTKLPSRKDPKYAESLRTVHSSILGICALIESFPYSVESWMPPLTEGSCVLGCGHRPDADHRFPVLANHATDPPPISTTIRKCASEFKKVWKWISSQALWRLTYVLALFIDSSGNAWVYNSIDVIGLLTSSFITLSCPLFFFVVSLSPLF